MNINYSQYIVIFGNGKPLGDVVVPESRQGCENVVKCRNARSRARVCVVVGLFTYTHIAAL